MVTSRDVAQLAGVSQATVSRVLQERPNVREETRQKVQAALSSAGYVPNEHARAMRTGQTGVLGVVTGRITNPFYPELIAVRVLSRRTRSEVGETAAGWSATPGGFARLPRRAVTSRSPPA